MDKQVLINAINYLKKDGLISGKVLAQQLGCSEANCNYYINKYNLRTEDVFTQIPKGFIKLFSEDNELSNYWLGYLQADGCVYSRSKNNKKYVKLILECQQKDKELLEHFCDDAKINKLRIHNTEHGDSLACRIDIGSSCFETFPSISELKSYKNDSLPRLSNTWAYLLGLFDGDGTASHSVNNRIIFLARAPMVYQIKDFLYNQLPDGDKIYIIPNNKTEGLYRLNIGPGKYFKSLNNNFNFIYNKWINIFDKPKLKRKLNYIEQNLIYHSPL